MRRYVQSRPIQLSSETFTERKQFSFRLAHRTHICLRADNTLQLVELHSSNASIIIDAIVPMTTILRTRVRTRRSICAAPTLFFVEATSAATANIAGRGREGKATGLSRSVSLTGGPFRGKSPTPCNPAWVRQGRRYTTDVKSEDEYVVDINSCNTIRAVRHWRLYTLKRSETERLVTMFRSCSHIRLRYDGHRMLVLARIACTQCIDAGLSRP